MTQSKEMRTSEKSTYTNNCPRKTQTASDRERQKHPVLSVSLEDGLAEPVLLKHLSNGHSQIVFSWCRDFLSVQATSQSFHTAECEAASYSE